MSVTYIGFHINIEGLHISKDRVNTIIDAPPPQNVSELKTFLVNYYFKFIKNMSSKDGTLYDLLINNTKF